MSNGHSKESPVKYLPEFIVTVASGIVVYYIIGMSNQLDDNSLAIRGLETEVKSLSSEITNGMSDRFTGAEAAVLRRRVERLEEKH